MNYVRTALVCLLILGIFIDISIPPGSRARVPFSIAGLAGIILLMLNFQKIRLEHFLWILSLVALCLISFFLRALTLSELSSSAFLMNRTMSWFVLAYGIVVGYSGYLELIQWDRKKIGRMLHIFLLTILIGAALENFTPFKAISDSFRLAFYERGVYEADLRDIALYGGVRPKFFTKEPSHLAQFLVLFSIAWLLIAEEKQKHIFFFIYVSLGFLLIRSPVVFMAPVVGFVSIILSREHGYIYRHILPLVVFILLLTPVLGIIAEETIAPRLDLIASGRDASFIARFLAPLHVMWNVIADYPLLGLGFGGKEFGLRYMAQVTAEVSGKSVTIATHHLGHNYILSSIIEFGLIGFPIFLFLYWRAFVVFARRDFLIPIVALVGFMQSFGSVNSIRLWVFLFVICAVTYVRTTPKASVDRTRDEFEPSDQIPNFR